MSEHLQANYTEPGHEFMIAGERTEDVLDKYKLLKNHTGAGGEIDWDVLGQLKNSIQ